MQDDWSTLEKELSSGSADAFLASLPPEDLLAASAHALALGYPQVAAQWSAEPLVKAAAFLRMGQPSEVFTSLPTTENARVAVLKARALWQLQDVHSQIQAEFARKLARDEGDAGAIIASAALLGEMQLREPKLALRTLAEALKIAEMIGEEADAYLLAVLAHAQQRSGGTSKAHKTAEKALSRSPERSPVRVIALLLLNEADEAKKVAQAGQLGDVWFRPFR